MHRKIGKDRTCTSRDMLADRQTPTDACSWPLSDVLKSPDQNFGVCLGNLVAVLVSASNVVRSRLTHHWPLFGFDVWSWIRHFRQIRSVRRCALKLKPNSHCHARHDKTVFFLLSRPLRRCECDQGRIQVKCVEALSRILQDPTHHQML